MNFIELVSFVFTLLVMIWLVVRKTQEAPIEVNEEVEPAKEYVKRLDIEVEEIKQTPSFKTARPKSTAYAGSYALHAKPSRLKKLINGLPSKKQMIVIQEVLNPPKGLE